MIDIRDILKKNLVYYTKSKQISQKELSERLGVTQSAVSHWFKGDNSPNIEIVSKIAEILEVPMSVLLTDVEADSFIEQKTPPSAEDSAPEGEKVSFEELHQLLVALGFVRDGQDLSDEDLAFLTHIIGLLDAWFSENH